MQQTTTENAAKKKGFLPSMSKKKVKKKATRKRKPPMAERFNKYELYEESVQSPQEHVDFLNEVFEKNFKRKPRKLREDFCGTFQICCHWVAHDDKNTAIGLDLDPEPLAYGRENHLSKLTEEQQSRVNPMQKNVLSTTKEKADVLAACNFSFNVFKDRPTFKKYLKSCYNALDNEGLALLEMVGGTEMTEPHEERKPIEDEVTGKKKFTYIWEQRTFNAINNEGDCFISFKFPDGSVQQDAFHYDWRFWSTTEITDLMKEVGFDEALIYWEGFDEDGEGDGEYYLANNEENCDVWIAYVVGVKKKA